MDGVVQGQDWSEQRNFCPLDAWDCCSGEDGGIGGKHQQRSVVVFREADPVKAHFVSERDLLKHLLHHAQPELWLKEAGRRGPTCFIHRLAAISRSWQEGCFHSTLSLSM